MSILERSHTFNPEGFAEQAVHLMQRCWKKAKMRHPDTPELGRMRVRLPTWIRNAGNRYTENDDGGFVYALEV